VRILGFDWDSTNPDDILVLTAHEAEHERWWEIYAKAKNLEP
jgi:hypothetical protein